MHIFVEHRVLFETIINFNTCIENDSLWPHSQTMWSVFVTLCAQSSFGSIPKQKQKITFLLF